jgi:DNA repair photolyase
VPLEPDLCIQTKSDLVLRDMDIIKKFKNKRVGLTITTLDDNLRREIEPFASPVQNRIKALETLKENGIETYVFIGPILPFLADWKKIVLATRHCADYYMFENLNISGPLWKCTENWLEKFHPNLLRGYKDIYFSDSSCWNRVEKDIEKFCQEKKVPCGIYFHHKK